MSSEFCRVSMGIPAAIGVSIGLAAGTINARGSIEQRKRWARDLLTFDKVGAWAITEPDAGSDAFGGMRTTVKRDGDAWTGFESWSFGAIAQEPERFERAMRDMCEATPEQCRSGEWAHLHEKAPEPLAQRAASAREASRAHAGQEARAPMARERAVGAE